jgi:hypothetical protein
VFERIYAQSGNAIRDNRTHPKQHLLKNQRLEVQTMLAGKLLPVNPSLARNRAGGLF